MVNTILLISSPNIAVTATESLTSNPSSIGPAVYSTYSPDLHDVVFAIHQKTLNDARTLIQNSHTIASLFPLKTKNIYSLRNVFIRQTVGRYLVRLTRRPPKPVHHGTACRIYKQINLCRVYILYFRLLDRQSISAGSKFVVQIVLTRATRFDRKWPPIIMNPPVHKGKRNKYRRTKSQKDQYP